MFIGFLVVLTLASAVYCIYTHYLLGFILSVILFIPLLILWFYSKKRQSTKERFNIK